MIDVIHGMNADEAYVNRIGDTITLTPVEPLSRKFDA